MSHDPSEIILICWFAAQENRFKNIPTVAPWQQCEGMECKLILSIMHLIFIYMKQKKNSRFRINLSHVSNCAYIHLYIPSINIEDWATKEQPLSTFFLKSNVSLNSLCDNTAQKHKLSDWRTRSFVIYQTWDQKHSQANKRLRLTTENIKWRQFHSVQHVTYRNRVIIS